MCVYVAGVNVFGDRLVCLGSKSLPLDKMRGIVIIMRSGYDHIHIDCGLPRPLGESSAPIFLIGPRVQ